MTLVVLTKLSLVCRPCYQDCRHTDL